MGKDKKISIVLGIAFGILILVGAIGLSVWTEENPADINHTVTITDISYTLTSVKTASTIIDKADGQFLIVTLGVLNNGKESETIKCSYFKLIDSKGRSFNSDKASPYLDDDIFLSEVNPDVPPTGRLWFDVPKTADTYTLQISGDKHAGSIIFDVGST